MNTISDPKEINYAISTIKDVSRVVRGDKPLVIVSAGKSPMAFGLSLNLARKHGLVYRIVQLICEDGELHSHLFAGRDTMHVEESIEAIFDRVSEDITRQQLQVRLGDMQGHSPGEVFAFTRSLEGLTCECDCCGGVPNKLLTHQPTLMPRGSYGRDAQKARMLENCYQY